MLECLNQLRPNVTLHVILACHRALWQECGITFKRRGNRHGAGRQRATTNPDGLFVALYALTAQIEPRISKGFGFLHKPFENVSKMLPTVFQ